MKKIWSAAGGFLAGALNGLLGAGGGMIVVPMLRKSGVSTRKSHATSVGIILPICLFSSILYLSRQTVTLADALPFLIPGVLGSLLGAWLLPKVNETFLRRLFGALMLWAGVRMLFR